MIKFYGRWLTRSGLKATISRSRGEHANHYTTDAAFKIANWPYGAKFILYYTMYIYLLLLFFYLFQIDETLNVETIFRNSFSRMRQIRGNQDFFVYFAEISYAFHKILISEAWCYGRRPYDYHYYISKIHKKNLLFSWIHILIDIFSMACGAVVVVTVW